MKASELLTRIQGMIAEHGDVRVFISDSFTPVKKEHLNIYEPITECPKERKRLGTKYLHISGGL